MSKRRGNNEGSWIKKKSGWEYRISLGRNASGLLIRKSFYGKTKSECTQKYANFMKSRPIISSTMILSDWTDHFIPVVKMRGVKERTLTEYRTYIDLHIKPSFIGAMKLSQIKPMDVDAFISSFSNYSGSFRGKLLRILRNIFKLAIQNDLCVKDPCVNTQVKNRIKKASASNTFNLAECKKIRDNCIDSDSPIALAILIFLYTGMRRGELLGLQWSDINFKKRTISINRAVCIDGKNKKFIDDRTKTPAGLRIVPLTRQLAEALLNAQKRSLFIVCSKHDDYYSPHGFQKAYRKYIANIDGVRLLGTHAFRHAIATHLGNEGVPVDEIANIVGHDDPTVTQKVYMLYDEKRSVQAIQKLPY